MNEPRRLLSLLSESTGRKSSLKRKANESDVVGRNQEFNRIGEVGSYFLRVMSPDWLPKAGNAPRLTSANNRQKTSASTLLGFVNNKDSSRDSAYGFSSGESKVTTRESTPEKRKTRKKVHMESTGRQKYKSNLSTVASSINQESLGDSLSFNPIPNPAYNSANPMKPQKKCSFVYLH